MTLSPRFHLKLCFSEPASMHPSSPSAIVLNSCWEAAVEAGETFTARRGRQLPPCEAPIPASQADLSAAQAKGFVLP